MTAAKRTYKTVVAIGVPRVGPERYGVKYCLRCQLPILPGEHWRKIDRGRGACAVGLHDHCPEKT